MNKLSKRKIAANRKKQKKHKQSACFKIKEQANCQQICCAYFIKLVNEGVHQENNYKERPEKQLGKEQGLVLRKRNYIVKKFYGFRFFMLYLYELSRAADIRLPTMVYPFGEK